MSNERPTFEVTVHPGRDCGDHEDGSYCYQDGAAHYWVPSDVAAVPAEPVDWKAAGWSTIDDQDEPFTFRREGDNVVINAPSMAMMGLGFRVEVTVPFDELRDFLASGSPASA
jgi:hypothetical protein